MNFVADEGVDRQIVERLRHDGHAVVWIAEDAPSLPDENVLALAVRNDRLLITADKDFGDLVVRQRRMASSIILIRLAGVSSSVKAAMVSAVVRRYAAELRDHFTVISPGAVRIRRLVR